MSVRISLREFVGEMQIVSDDLPVYLNKKTGEFITIRGEDIDLLESDDVDWSECSESEKSVLQETQTVLSSDDYLELPSSFEINEYEIMEKFCFHVSDPKISNELVRSIRGAGAFRRFKDAIYRYGIEKDWFRFRDEAYKDIAISWLESHGLEYIDDMDNPEKDA